MIWAIIAVGFLMPVAVGLFTRLQPMIAGFVWPLLVAIGTAIYVYGIEDHSAADAPTTIAIPLFGILSLAGGVPGGLVGWILQYKRAARDTG
jgi:hypothetical protein